jgi:4-carboxymuconolactone decarboxylase
MRKRHLSGLILVCLIISVQDATAQTVPSTAILTAKQKSIISITALTAIGTDTLRLRKALDLGSTNGLTVNESKEVLVHLYAYCGFPRSLNGLSMLESVLKIRKTNGIIEVMGRESSAVPAGNKYEAGKKTLELLSGQPYTIPQSGYAVFAPIIDTFLREHLFADIFNRNVLTYAERELTTISALASMEGVAPQLQAYLGLGINVGLTELQLNEMLSMIQTYVGKKQAKAGREVLAKLIATKADSSSKKN